MTIEKGRPWGTPWSPEDHPDPVPVADDAALAEHLTPLLAPPLTPGDLPVAIQARSGSVTADRGWVAFAVGGGDLLRTIGVERPRAPAERHLYPIDVGLARLERRGREPVTVAFVAHLTVRDRPLAGLGPGLSVAVMNAAWLGRWRLGPRAHPNDGRLDVTEGTVGLTQRREANRRARSGTHLPHPGLGTSRVERWEASWNRPVAIWLDGVRRGRFHAVHVELVADAAAVIA